MTQIRLWLRWSWRDLRQRWVLVGAIALVIALGTGTYAGLLGTSAWRQQSNDASFALLNTHDLRVTLPQGGRTAEGRLAGAIAGIPHASDLTGVRERLVVPTQIAGPRGLLVPGELVGTETGPGPAVDGVSVSVGRALAAADEGKPRVIADQAFATKNELPAGAELTISGGRRLEVVGHGQSPEYFLVTGGQGGLPFLSQKSYGVLFGSLLTVQRAIGAPGQVNDLVITLRPGTDRDAVARELREALDTARPSLAATLTTRNDIDSYRVLYEDIHGDARLWRVIALLVLFGAALAALNLTTRIVEAQRREIGIGMALGVPTRMLAVRPLLFGVQVAMLGVGLGLLVGWAVGIPLRAVFVDMLPLPIWRTPLQVGVFAQAAALGFVLPFAAVAWPVWRALRVQPVEAIRVGHLAARGGGFAPLLRRLPVPGPGYRQIPLRNLLRTPRRSALTAIGIAAAITTLVTTVGFLDTFRGTLDRANDELLHAEPDRVSVTLDSFQPLDGEVIRAVRTRPEVAAVDAGLLLPSTARTAGQSVELALEVVPAGARWTPTVVAGSGTGGLVLARKAADDLGLRVGDSLTIEHPQATATGLRTVETTMRVAGLHPNPMRMLAYLDPASARVFGLTGTANILTVQPAGGSGSDAVRRALLGVPHVASAQIARATTDGMRSSLDEYVGILQVAALVTLLLALLIAFNTTSIAVDERSREHATMLAFGLPVRTVLTMTTVETVLVGAVGTLIGVAGGYATLSWMTATTIPSVLPEIGVTATLSAATIAEALALGILTVAVAPLFTLRRLRRMDIPSRLRVME
ncbi:putative ABC transport system permease protein [Kribbella orskensis]|uniref:ABC transport system permease protein n=1 Tax=Kribbella orskensis TaxID=2512216 RepID=A0ABY2B7N4_9ACTN|nr:MULTISPECIES: FtsX-like permease family protein [Kribbella]TCN29616.1 putative ABC transport system permease protein [Kribbella sp. VKM Ac-2500]TCO09950.1 putative ABC transport system permease protein [Kribbella orskensis]